MIGSRTKLSATQVKSSNYWIKYLERDEFKEKILPALQRALLRNPEIVLEVTRHVFEDITIELSDFVKEILPSLNSQLTSKDETIQNESTLVVKFLVKQCNNNDAIQFILKHLFDLLNGSQGKLSQSNQKCSIVSAIAYCSANYCFSSNDILQCFVDTMGEFLKSETHEGTLLFCLEQISVSFRNLQTNTFSAGFLTKLKDFFKVIIT